MKEKSRKMALCGVLCALSTVCMLLGGIIPFATFCCPALAAALGAGQDPVKTPGHGTMKCMAKWLDAEKQTAPIWLAFDFD